MTSFLSTHDVFSPSQYGFIGGRGTQTLLEDFSDLLNYTFDRNQIACALFLDVSKAFDSVCHTLLLTKLQRLGFRDNFLRLLENFLLDRTQVVRIGKFSSNASFIRSGVPQGSILSPLLFNLYVNDLAYSVSSSIFQYADDTVLVSYASRHSDAIKSLQVSAMETMNWFTANSIDVNTKKTQLICFHNPLKKVDLTQSLFLHSAACSSCSCIPVKYVSTVKYLGLYFDSDLSWNSHLAYVCKKIRAVPPLLYKLRTFIAFSLRKVIVYSLCDSLLRYGISVGHCALRWKETCVLKKMTKYSKH